MMLNDAYSYHPHNAVGMLGVQTCMACSVSCMISQVLAEAAVETLLHSSCICQQRHDIHDRLCFSHPSCKVSMYCVVCK